MATEETLYRGEDLRVPHRAQRLESIFEDRGLRIGEAAEMYGDVQTAEEYGYVSRGLKSRHVQFIALGGAIGTALFLSIGYDLAQGGPLSLLLGYTLAGAAVFAMMQSLGEMVTWLPLPGAIPHICAHYVDDAMGFAVGWNYWYSCALILCVEIYMASITIHSWPGADGINGAAWISIIIFVVLCLNVFSVAIYGEAEFCFAGIKIITILGLLLMALILDCGGGPDHFAYGFYYWQNPGAMKEYWPGFGNTGRFLGFFTTLIHATFAYSGVEVVAVAAGEAENPRKNMPKAVRRVFWRILSFYVLGSLAIGVLVPYNDKHLIAAQFAEAYNHASSPWVIAVTGMGIPVLPSIINAVIVSSASSSANAFLFAGSRILYALAQNGQAPRFLLYCTKLGVPIWCVLTTAAVSLLTYLSLSTSTVTDFLSLYMLANMTTLFTWCSVCITYIQFYRALLAQGVDRNKLAFKSPLQPYTAWFALCFSATIILFHGFYAFTPWNINSFFGAYIGIPIYFFLYFFWKIVKRTKWVNPAEADIITGKAAIDVAEFKWPKTVPENL